ncbi:hypothetical protein I549_1813 [Mycobacterium avium subsp. avium 2285 (R)]|nr:hypothetical protein I549_1813 [Mycobacterium avium subsp. avium 2285 (R)]
MHPSGRRRPRAGHRANPARRVHRLRAQPSAAGMAAAQTGARHRQRDGAAPLGGPAAVRPGASAGDRGVAGPGRRRVRGVRRRRSGGRRGGARHPIAGVVVAVGFSAPTRRGDRHRHQLRHPALPHPRRADRPEGGGGRRLARRAAGAGHAVLRGPGLGVDHVRGGRRQTAPHVPRNADAGAPLAARPLRRRAGPGRAAGRSRVSRLSGQPVAPLRQAGPRPGRHRRPRRRGGQLQPHLRPGDDDDRAAGRSSAPRAAMPRRPAGRGAVPGHRQDHLPGVDDERHRRRHLPPRHHQTTRPVVVATVGRAVRPVPGRRRDRTRSGGMVSAPVLAAGQPLPDPAAPHRRARRRAQHAAVAGAAPRAGRPGTATARPSP